MGTGSTTDIIREFVIAGHGNLDRVKEMLAEWPELLNVAYEWQPGDTETALQGASHVGNRAIAEYLLVQGAPLDICAAAMLGRRDSVERFLSDDAGLINTHGAHGIPLLTHAAFSGDVELVAMLHERGAQDGASSALMNAVAGGHLELAQWLLRHAQPDLTVKNFQGKTALDIAEEHGDEALVALLTKT